MLYCDNMKYDYNSSPFDIQRGHGTDNNERNGNNDNSDQLYLLYNYIMYHRVNIPCVLLSSN